VAKTLVACQPMVAAKLAQAMAEAGGGGDGGGSGGGGGGGGGGGAASTCFHVLGVDILLDQDLRPWLLEVNHNPSLTCDTPFDHALKSGLVRNTLQLLQLTPPDKARQADRGQREKLAERMHACEEADARTYATRGSNPQPSRRPQAARQSSACCSLTRSSLALDPYP
jgi:hypothetical protein